MTENLENRISSEQAKEAIFKMHNVQSSASELDLAVDKSLSIFDFEKGIIDSDQTIVLLGDSLIAKNSSQNGNYTYSSGFFTWANAMTGQKFKVLKNAGVGGQTSTQILNRVDIDVIPLAPTHCIFICGMNDGVTDVDTGTLKANIVAIYNKLNTAGIYSFILTNTTTLNYPAKNAQALQINSWMFTYFKDKQNVAVIDINAPLIDSFSITGLIKNKVVSDNLHPSANGGCIGGVPIANILKKYSQKVFLPVSALDTKKYSVTSNNLINDSLQLNDAIIGFSGLTELYNSSSVSITGNGVNTFTNIGNDTYQLVQIDNSNTPFIETGIALTLNDYYVIDCDLVLNSGYGISSDALSNIPLKNGITIFKAGAATLRLKRTASPTNVNIKINSVKKLTADYLAKLIVLTKDNTLSISNKLRDDNIGNYKDILISNNLASNTILFNSIISTLPIKETTSTCYAEIYIHQSVNLKDISLHLEVNNSIVTSSLVGTSDVLTNSLDIDSEYKLLLLSTPSYFHPSNVDIKQCNVRLQVKTFDSGNVEIYLGRLFMENK